MKLPALQPTSSEPVRHWGEILHQLAEASGCRTQRQLAEQLHVAPGTLNRYLTCERLPDENLVRNLFRLARTNGSSLSPMIVEHTYVEAVEAQRRNGQIPRPGPSEGTHPTRARRPVRTALATAWTWLRRLLARHKVVAVGAAALVVTVVVALVITPWGTSDELDGPRRLPLLRYQAPTPDRANFISPTEPGPSGWTAMPALGEVYAPGQSGVDGLVPVYRFRCTNCGDTLIYFLSRDKSDRPDFEFEAEAFQCFDPNRPPAGTRPLQSLWNRHRARLWAVPGTSEYQEATDNGFRDPNPGGLPLCYIW